MGDAKKKIAIISPYLDVLGGGERFILTIAEYFSKKADVTLFWNNKKITADSKSKLGIDLSRVYIESVPHNFLSILTKFIKFNHLFYMTDGSLFFSFCRNNYLVIQSPAHIPQKNISNSIKLSRFTKIICYSDFVKTYIKSRLNKEAIIIAPPVLTNKFRPTPKENLIISVGRFFPWLHSKKQEVLVEAFKKLYKFKELRNWKLLLIGSVDKGAEAYFEKIQHEAAGYPINIIQNSNLNELTNYYSKAKIYWHAAGYGENLEKNPEKAEHFGITTVESMSAGCIPLVFNGGGQKEIVRENENGFLWNTVEELVNKTKMLVNNDKQLTELPKQAKNDSLNYSLEIFIKKIDKLVF